MARETFRVLHVEDDEQVAASVRMLLAPLGYEVFGAADGNEAIARIVSDRLIPDVLIMDVRLPGEFDGIDVAQEVCRLLGHVVPTILLSGDLASAGTPWLPGAPLISLWKPVEPETLVSVVEAFCRLGRKIRSRANVGLGVLAE